MVLRNGNLFMLMSIGLTVIGLTFKFFKGIPDDVDIGTEFECLVWLYKNLYDFLTVLY